MNFWFAIFNLESKPPTDHFQFSVFDFQNIENCFSILCFLETKIDNSDCKFVIFSSWGIKHPKSRLWIFDLQFSIWNQNQLDENHTDLRKRPLKKVQLSCFKLYRAYSISFSSPNVDNLFLNWSSGNENQNRCFAFMSSTRREIRHFHYVVVQWRKTRDARAKLTFVLPIWNLFLFCCSLWRRSRRCWSS